MKINVGGRIKSIRKQKGITAKHVAKLVGISPSTLSKYENQESDVKADLLPEFSKALGVDIKNFFAEEIDETSTNEISA